MDAAYRQIATQQARLELAAAQKKMSSIAKWGKAKREASEQVEFWGNRLSFLTSAN